MRRTVEQIIETGEAQFPIIGASLDGRYDGEGARIAIRPQSGDGTPPIVPDGPADQAGLQAGDVILEIDGKPVEGSSELIVAIRSRSPGDTVSLTVRRSGSERVVDVTLGATEGWEDRCVLGIGAGEFVALAIVALIVLGPEKLPGYAAEAARVLRKVRDMANDARAEVRRELGPEFDDLSIW